MHNTHLPYSPYRCGVLQEQTTMSYMELEGLDLTLAPMPSGFSFLGALVTGIFKI